MVTQHKPVISSEIMKRVEGHRELLGQGSPHLAAIREGGIITRATSTSQENRFRVATKTELDAWVASMSHRATFPLNKTGPRTSEAAVIQSLERNFAEAQRLRGEMVRLRNDLRNSIEMLRACIQFVHCDPEGQVIQLRTGIPISFDQMKPNLDRFLRHSGDSDRHQSQSELKAKSCLRRAA